MELYDSSKQLTRVVKFISLRSLSAATPHSPRNTYTASLPRPVRSSPHHARLPLSPPSPDAIESSAPLSTPQCSSLPQSASPCCHPQTTSPASAGSESSRTAMPAYLCAPISPPAQRYAAIAVRDDSDPAEA